MKIRNILLAGLALLGNVAMMHGVVAKPGWIEARQPDGSVKIIRMEGGPRGHQIYTPDDKPLMTNERGFYVPADAAFMANYEKKLNDRRKAATSGTPMPLSLPGLMKNPFPSTGDQRALVILVEFPDCRFTIDNPRQHFQEMLNGESYTKDGATGSARKYYYENSNGAFNINFDIYGPVEVSNSYQYYGANDYFGEDMNPHEMILEACALLDDKIDFTQYDKNGDGEIDMVYVFYAGYGEADGGGPYTIWPHSAGIASDFVIYKYFDNKLLNHYACSMELQYSSPNHSRPDGIGTFCHEFGHVLGIPDLYSTIGGGAFTPGEWSLMDCGSYNNESRTPPCLSGFERAAIGWLEPRKLSTPGPYSLKPLGEGYNEAFMISTSSQNEYFILENRQQVGWDTYLPHHGMLVWHIDYNSTVWNNNTVNINARHQRVDLVEADGIPSNWTIDGDAFPGLYEKTEFTESTKPALVSWNNQSLGVGIRDIKETGGDITFSVGDLLGISLNVTQLSLHSQETSTLRVTFNPTNSNQWPLVWKSSDPEVAEVSDQGVVTALKSGTTNITVAVENYPDITATCTVEVVPYSLKYLVDGAIYATQYYEKGETVVAPKQPEKVGYSFKEWRGLPAVMPGMDLTVLAVFDKKEYTITYFVDGEEYKKETYKFGSTIKPPDAPQKEGYSFTGWSGIPETMPADNVIVNATFAVNSYILTYYVDDVEYNKQTIEYGAAVSPLDPPSKLGYTFSGWSEIPSTMPAKNVDVRGSFSVNIHNVYFMVDGTPYHTASVAFGETIPLPKNPQKDGSDFTGWAGLPNTMPDNDVTVEATFGTKMYVIKYYLDNELYREEKRAFGEQIVPLAVPEKEGYTFSGWSELPETMPAQDIEVYGSFSVNSHTVTFIVDGNEYHSTSVKYGTSIPLPETPKKEGYSFIGWSQLPETMPDHNVIVTALFSVNQYEITYYLDGEIFNIQTWNYGSDITPLPDPEKTGYTFSGWEGLPQTMPAGDVAVYGSFSVNSHTVTFIVDGEEYHKVNVDYGAAIKLPETPVKEGYTFTGWTMLPETMPDEDVTVTASFIINEYEISYYLDDVEYKKQTWKYGESIKALENPEKTGYTFTGWQGLPATMPSHDVIVNGYFRVNSYSISYFVDDALYDMQILEYGEKIIPPTVATDQDREFLGWTTSIPDKMPAEDLSIYGYTTLKEASVGSIESLEYSLYDVYTIGGIILAKQKSLDDLKVTLSPGIYIFVNNRQAVKIEIK